MRARRMSDEIDPALIAAEARSILVGPGDRTAALIDHRKDIAIGLADIVEVDRSKMRAGLDEVLGHEGVLRRAPAAPGAAMQKDRNGRVRALRLEDFDFLDLGRTIGKPRRLA